MAQSLRSKHAELSAELDRVTALHPLAQARAAPVLVAALLAILGDVIEEIEALTGRTHHDRKN